MKKKIIIVAAICMMIVLLLTSFAIFSDKLKVKKGSLIGNSYTIYQYDNYGNQTLLVEGRSIEISPFEPTYDSEGKQELTSVLDVTIDGSQIIAVGNTLIFEEKGIDRMMGFDEIQEFASIYSNSGLRYIPFDKLINDVKNKIGKSRLILVYSQLGEPIGIYQGNSVYVTVPDNLPKMTRLNIDGHSLYLHRVNYTIIDMKLLK